MALTKREETVAQGLVEVEKRDANKSIGRVDAAEPSAPPPAPKSVRSNSANEYFTPLSSTYKMENNMFEKVVGDARYMSHTGCEQAFKVKLSGVKSGKKVSMFSKVLNTVVMMTFAHIYESRYYTHLFHLSKK